MEELKNLGLAEEQLQKVEEFFTTYKTSVENEIKENGNKFAEGIIDGASKLAEEKTGLKRNAGEKYADYLVRVSGEFLSKKEQDLLKIKSEYEEKIKGLSTDDAKAELDKYKKQVAELEQEKGYKEKYEGLFSKYENQKLSLAFGSAIPTELQTNQNKVVKATLDAVKNEILKTHNIEQNEKGEFIAIDKDNQYKITPLNELIKSNELIKELEGFGKAETKTGFTKEEKESVKIDGIDIKITKDMDDNQISLAIRSHLLGKGLDLLSREYSDKFVAMQKKIYESMNK
jgi:phage terminase Nu1 subunit (DNA packaging protein)